AYALAAGMPVAKVLNNAGYFTAPSASNVAIALLQARVNTDSGSPDYLTQDLHGVYVASDTRAYPLSYYGYLIVPLVVRGNFLPAKGPPPAAFGYYALCHGQQEAASLGNAPLPVNLVQAGFDQLRRIPGADTLSITIQGCDNPTFNPDGTDRLTATA